MTISDEIKARAWDLLTNTIDSLLVGDDEDTRPFARVASSGMRRALQLAIEKIGAEYDSNQQSQG